MQRLAGRVAVINGAAESLGGAVALAMAREGAAVVFADTHEESLGKIKTELEKLNRKSIAMLTDVTDEDSVNRLISQALSEFERIDILVNGASMRLSALIEDTTEELWDTMIRVNLIGAFLCSKAVVPSMLKLRYGRIISFTSNEAFVGLKNGAPYAAAKAGIIGFSKALALELAPYQITVNTICHYSHGERPQMSGSQTGEPAEALSGRTGQPEGSVGPAIFLASDAASFITGQTLFVNGGALTGRLYQTDWSL